MDDDMLSKSTTLATMMGGEKLREKATMIIPFSKGGLIVHVENLWMEW